MQFEKIRRINKNKVIIGGLIGLGVIGAITILPSHAKYKLTESINIVNGTVNYKVPDFNMVAMYREKSGTTGNYEQITSVPTSGYTLNTTNTKCEVGGVKDSSIGISYSGGKLNFTGVSKTGTKCYAYFDYIRDTSRPTITSVTKTSDEETSITVSVVAIDDRSVTEYWYKIGSSSAVKGTGSTYTFTGLTAGTEYTIEVYVKDAAGNTSTTWTGSFATKTSAQTLDTILASITVKTTTPNFRNVATTDEGVFRVSDGMYGGNSYYWRGAVTNNYVKFAGFCWRIVRINGDGSIRLIYDGTTCHANGTSTAESIAVASQNYNSSSNRSEYVGYTYTQNSQRGDSSASNLKKQTDSWYKTNITNKGYDGKVATGKFCNDRSIEGGSTWSSQPSTVFDYGAMRRLGSIKTPTLDCPKETGKNDIYSLKVGAITADEVAFAGGVFGTANSSYYLYNGQYYWTMSPSNWDGSNGVYVFGIHINGGLGNSSVSLDLTLQKGIRPVINLLSSTEFKAGTTGTKNNPYEVI